MVTDSITHPPSLICPDHVHITRGLHLPAMQRRSLLFYSYYRGVVSVTHERTLVGGGGGSSQLKSYKREKKRQERLEVFLQLGQDPCGKRRGTGLQDEMDV